MQANPLADMNCSLAQTLAVIGERWTLMILRDAFFGVTRFDQFQRRLGVARNVLAQRLGRLVDEGILAKSGGGSRRTAYRLTDKGFDLVPVLLAIAHWGDRHKPNPRGARMIFVDRDTGAPIQSMGIRAADGRPLAPAELGMKRGPGLAPPSASANDQAAGPA